MKSILLFVHGNILERSELFHGSLDKICIVLIQLLEYFVHQDHFSFHPILTSAGAVVDPFSAFVTSS